MSNEFEAILSSLDTSDSSLRKLTIRISDLCASKNGAEEAIKELLEKTAAFEADARCCENVPFCSLLLSFAYYHWGDRIQAAKYVEDATNKFNRCGDQWNRALSLWAKSVIYQDASIDQAITECKSAYGLFGAIVNTSNRRGSRDRYNSSKDIMGQIGNKAMELEERLAHSKIPVKNKKDRPPEQRTSASFIYGVLDLAHASRQGRFVLDDEQVGEMSVEEIKFDDKRYKIYNVREGSQITLVPGRDYRWLKVAGDSMDQARPIFFEPDDYVLADLSQNPQVGNIVIAGFKRPPTPAEHAGVIKRYTTKGLKSESTKQIELIPLSEVDIRGVVIAVAKPA